MMRRTLIALTIFGFIAFLNGLPEKDKEDRPKHPNDVHFPEKEDKSDKRNIGFLEMGKKTYKYHLVKDTNWGYLLQNGRPLWFQFTKSTPRVATLQLEDGQEVKFVATGWGVTTKPLRWGYVTVNDEKWTYYSGRVMPWMSRSGKFIRFSVNKGWAWFKHDGNILKFKMGENGETTRTEVGSQCDQPKLVGMCRALIVSWYYDANTDSCRRFGYGGCGGNSNRFASKGVCMNTCKPGKE